jgi:hypothetical protein
MKKTPVSFLLSIVIQLTYLSVFGLTADEKSYPDTFYNRTYSPDIHTVLLRSATWELSSPLIESGSEQLLELHFDDLTGANRNFGYTLVHCDAYWQRSDLAPQEYLSGFGQGIIHESSSSFNTTYHYIHYRLSFPEADCMPLLSGNYAIVVYENEDPSNIILTRRFYVTEKIIQGSARLMQPLSGEFAESGQQLDLTLNYPGSVIQDPLQDLIIVIKQNNRDDNSLTIRKPSFSRPGILEFKDMPEMVFNGGNEFRNLDLKSMKYQTENVARIEFQKPYYHVYLKTDEDRSRKPYFTKPDLNGAYFIDLEKSDDKHTEADYVYVQFRFKAPVHYADADIFVTGGFSDWTLQEANKMIYDPFRDDLVATLLLKQGFYDYCYAVLDPKTGVADETPFEGSYYETSNDYAFFIYFHDRPKRVDRLIGYLPLKRG